MWAPTQDAIEFSAKLQRGSFDEGQRSSTEADPHALAIRKRSLSGFGSVPGRYAEALHAVAHVDQGDVRRVGELLLGDLQRPLGVPTRYIGAERRVEPVVVNHKGELAQAEDAPAPRQILSAIAPSAITISSGHFAKCNVAKLSLTAAPCRKPRPPRASSRPAGVRPWRSSPASP